MLYPQPLKLCLFKLNIGLIDKQTVEIGFTKLENMGLGKIIRSRSNNNKSLISFEKIKIKKQTTELINFFKMYNVDLEKYIEQQDSELHEDLMEDDDDSFSILDRVVNFLIENSNSN